MTTPRLPPGRIVDGRFTIQAELGRGPTCVTYRAITAPNREVAIRLLDPAIPNAEGIASTIRQLHSSLHGDLDRFIVPIVDGGRDHESGAPFFVVPLVATPSLAQLVAICPLEGADAAAMIAKLGRALDALHAGGALHLALKPTNVFVGAAPDRVVQLTDPSTQLLRPEVDAESMRWLAPEQVGAASQVGPQADVFAMALVAFYSLTGASMLPAGLDLATWRSTLAHGLFATERARELGVTLPAAVDRVFRHALAIAPGERPTSASAFASALAAALTEDAPAATAVPANDAPAATAPPLLVPIPPPIFPLSPLPFEAPPLPAAAPEAPALAAPAMPVDPLGFGALPVSPAFPSAGGSTQGLLRDRRIIALAAALRDRRVIALAAGAAGLVLLLVIGILVVRSSSHKRGATLAGSTSVHAPDSREARAPEPSPAEPDAAPPPPAQLATTEPAASAEAPAPAPTASAEAPEPARLGPHQAELTVICEPVLCEIVLIDGKPMAGYPGPAIVRAGVHGVGVSRPGYGGQWQRVVVSRGDHKSVRFILTPNAPAGAKKPCGKFLRRCD